MIDEAVGRGARRRGRRGRGGAGAGPPRRPGRRLPAGRLRPLRGGEDRRPPPHRRRPRAGRAAGDPRRARRPLRAAAAARPRTCWRCSGRGSSSAWPGRAASSSAAGGSASPGSSSTPSRPACSAEQVEGALYEWREKTAAVRVPDEPEARLAAVLAMAEGPARGAAPQRAPKRICCPLRESEPGNLTMLPASVGAKAAGAEQARPRLRSASRCSSSARSSSSSSSASRSPRASAIRASPSGDVAVVEDVPERHRQRSAKPDFDTASLAAAGRARRD